MPSESWSVREKFDRADSATHQILLVAARRVFETKGFARTTIADITREAGVGRATFYVYFASKEEVFAVLANQVRDELVAAQDLGDLDPDDPWAVARATNSAFLEAYAAHRAFLTLIEHQAIADPAIAELREEIYGHSLERAQRYIQRLIDRGLADPPAAPAQLALAGFGLITAFAPLFDEQPERREDLLDGLVAIYLRQLGLPPEKPEETA